MERKGEGGRWVRYATTDFLSDEEVQEGSEGDAMGKEKGLS